ncbi:MAG: hypothetical protein QOD72_2009 [Acidimicrobiaceae bacterium]|jgi:hypothetical protein|nr:hypothetical protein [Acidimicrobiaceae bacterium]
MWQSLAFQIHDRPATYMRAKLSGLSVHIFGIRHHGPGSARSLVAALDDLQPDAVLIELPKEADDVLALAADPTMCPPVALLGYAVDHPERAAFLPFARFSPEWCAIRHAFDHGATVRSIDLALRHSLAVNGERGPAVDAVALLAAAAGEDDPERWWDDVVEHRGGDAAFAEITAAMAAVRADQPTPLDEARREATMRQGVRAAVADGFACIAVVCGAWHAPALTGGDEAADRRLLVGLPACKVGVTWVPWTHRRLAAASGYRAGVAAPAWYAHVHTHPGAAGVTRWFADAARLLRDADIPVSPDHVIAAVRLAAMTAALRHRPQAGLDEVLDAARSVLTEGGRGPLALIEDQLIVGEQLGSVPDSTPMVPLARDLADHQRRLRLKPDATARTVELDLRAALGRSRSQLLHRLTVLGVPWGRLEDGRRSAGTFRESWRLRWEPEFAVSLIEASAHGTTLPAAAESRLAEQAANTNVLADLTALVEAALLAGLPDAVAPIMRRLAGLMARDTDVADLMDAVGPLARAARYGDVRATDASAVHAVIDGLVVRVLAGLAPACRSLDADAAAAMAERLTATNAALALIDHAARPTDWPHALDVITASGAAHGLVQGRAARLLHDSGHWGAPETERHFVRVLSIGSPPPHGAAFVEGFLAGTGTVLLHDDGLLALLDGWVASLGAEAFVDVVPLLRRTFGAFEVAERRQIGQLVSGRGDGRPPAPYGDELDPARVGAAFVTVRMLLGVEP